MLKVIVMVVVVLTPVAPSLGLIEETVGVDLSSPSSSSFLPTAQPVASAISALPMSSHHTAHCQSAFLMGPPVWILKSEPDP